MSAWLNRWYVPVSLAVIAVLLLGLFRVKDEAGAGHATVRGLERDLAAARATQAELEAERQLLESPARLEKLMDQPGAALPASASSQPSPQPSP